MNRRIGSFRVVKELGRGGMGVVYEAVQERIGQRVAIKFLSPRLCGDPVQLERFFLEARAVAAVRHEGLVKIFDLGQLEDGTPYLIMEHLLGESLRERLLRRPTGDRVSPEEALRIAGQVAATFIAVHEQGIVHRDLKPENVVLVPDPVAPGGERAKVLDFGVAKFMHAPGPSTTPGIAVGTIAYMSPEQCRGAPGITDRADVYSLGAMVYEMLSGQTPFQGDPQILLRLHLVEEPPPLQAHRPGLPDGVAALVGRMLHKDPELRPSMAQVAEALGRITQGGGWSVSGPSGGPGPQLPVPSGPGQPGVTSGATEGRLTTGPGRGPRRARTVLVLAGLSSVLALFLLIGPWYPPDKMVWIPGGRFTMGSSTAEMDAAYAWAHRLGCDLCSRELYEREQPARPVKVSPFYLDDTEVTNERFARWLNRQRGLRIEADRRVMDGTVLFVDLYPGYGYSGLRYQDGRFAARRGFERKPVAQVSWVAAQRYCQGRGGRLPTEAEWEFAARGATNERFPWGDDDPRCEGVVFGRDRGQTCAGLGPGPAEVRTAAQDRSPFGVHDMAGNLAEWVMDRYRGRYPTCTAGCSDPLAEDNAPEDGGADVQVVRGGAWYRMADACRAAGRSRRKQQEVSGDIGFRCARPADG